MTVPNAAESVSEQIDSMEQEIVDFEQMLIEHKRSIADFMARENPQKDIVFPGEIFALRQDVLRVKTEIMFRRNKINRLRLGDEA